MSNKTFHILRRIWVLLAVLFFSLPALGKEEGVKLEWKGIPDSGGYMVEIRDSRGKITREKTNSTQIVIDLPPGNYEHRIGVLNRYGRVSVFSTWIPFDVILSQKPEIQEATQRKFLNKDLPETFEIKGKHFTDATKIIFKDSNGNEIPVKFVEVKNSETLVVTIDRKKAADGAISLRVENPRNKVAEKEDYLLVAETEDKLAELEERKGPSKGSNFDYGAVARSAVLPGWGQYYQEKSNFRVFVFPTLIALAGGYAAAAGSSYMGTIHSLEATKQSNILFNTAFLQSGDPTLFTLAFYNYTQITPQYSQAVAEYNQIGAALGVLGFFYLLNLADAGFFPGKKQVQIEGTDKPVTVSPILRNEREMADRSSGFAASSPFAQRMELGVQFSW